MESILFLFIALTVIMVTVLFMVIADVDKLRRQIRSQPDPSITPLVIRMNSIEEKMKQIENNAVGFVETAKPLNPDDPKSPMVDCSEQTIYAAQQDFPLHNGGYDGTP